MSSINDMPNVPHMRNVRIIDETPDLHRALADSSAYFGDESSLVSLYQLTGKPILIQNPSVPFGVPGDFDERLRPRKLTVAKDCIYITDLRTAGVFMLDKASKALKCYLCEGEFEQKFYNFMNVVECNGKLVFTPYYHNTLVVYDMVTQETQHIDVGLGESNCSLGHCNRAILHENSVWFVPTGASDVLRYDGETGKVERIPIKGAAGKYIDGFIQNGKLFLIGFTQNVLIIMDLRSRSYETLQIPACDAGFISACPGDDKDIWLTHISKPELYRFVNGRMTRYKLDEKEVFLCKAIYKIVYLFAISTEKVMKLDSTNGEIEDITHLFEKEPYTAHSTYFSDVAVCGETLWATNLFRGTFYEFDTAAGTVQATALYAPEEAAENCRTAYRDIFSELPRGNANDEFVLYESWGIHDLRGFLAALDSGLEFAVAKWRRKNADFQMRGDAGQRIYDYVKAQIFGR